MSEFTSGFLAGAFVMFGLFVSMLFVAGACKISGQLSRQEEEAERIGVLTPRVDPERVL